MHRFGQTLLDCYLLGNGHHYSFLFVFGKGRQILINFFALRLKHGYS